MKKFFILIIAVLLLFSCEGPTLSQKRAKRAAKASNQDIVIGLVDVSAGPSLLIEGATMAIEELNNRGGILGRRIRPIITDDEGSVKKAQEIARAYAKNLDVIAVIGHLWSGIAIPASITYEAGGILFISPGATNPGLIRADTKFIFRNIPSDTEVGNEMVKFAVRKGYQKIVVIYDRGSSSGKRLAEIFYDKADDVGIEIVAEKSYSGWEEDFRPLIGEIVKGNRFDAIFLGAGDSRSGAEFVKQLRGMRVNVPIIGNDLLDVPKFVNIAGKAGQGTVVPTVFDPKRARTMTRDFVKRFEERFDTNPDTWAAQGYDAVRVLAYAIEETGSTVPMEVATTLRFTEDWEGVTGSYSFTRDGNITGKSLFFKEVKHGEFKFIERELRHNVDPFEVLEDITLRLPMEGIIPTVDPGLTADTTSIEVVEQLFLGLTDFNPITYEPIPELATGWEVSGDGIVYRFFMRNDAKWSNGEPVTAHDIVWAVQRNILPETKAPFAYALYILKNGQLIHRGAIEDVSEIGVRAIDDFTVEFILEYPASYFPAIAGLWIYRPLPGETITTYGSHWIEPENIQTNGSYKLAAWDKGMQMILRRNTNYYDFEKVQIPEIRYYVIPESSVGLAMYKNDQLDIMGDVYLRIPLAEIPNIQAHPVLSQEYHSAPIFCTYSFAFNTRMEPVNNVLVRKAITSAIDRQLIIHLVTKGGQQAATTYTPPPVFGAVDPGEGVGIPFNPTQAQKWLAEAGYPEGEGFPEIRLLYNKSETHAEIAEAVCAFLKYYLNIEVIPEVQEWSEYVKSRTECLSEAMIRFGYCADYPDANNFLNELFHPLNSDNIVGWDNTEFADIIDRAQSESDSSKRRKLYKRAEEILCEEECVVLPIYFETAHYLVKPRVKGWYNMALGGQHIRNWYFEQ